MLSIPLSTFLLIQKNFCGYFPSCKYSKQEIWRCRPRKELEGADLNSQNTWRRRRNCTFFLKEAIKKPCACRRYVALGIPLCTWRPLGLWQSIVPFSSLLPGVIVLVVAPASPISCPLASVKLKKFLDDLFAWLTCIFSASWPLWVKV